MKNLSRNQDLIEKYGNMARYHAIIALLPKTFAATYAAHRAGRRAGRVQRRRR